MPKPGTDKLAAFFAEGVKSASTGKTHLTEYLKTVEGKTAEEIETLIAEATEQKPNL